MSKDCWAAIGFVILALLYIYQSIMIIFVLPINSECYYNSDIPPEPAINMSMDDFVFGGMIAGIIMFGILSGSSKCKSNGDGPMFCMITFYIIYNLFIVVWSILGIRIYSDYYGQVCQTAPNYSTIMNLGFYSELVISSLMIAVFIILCCIACRQSKEEPLPDRKRQSKISVKSHQKQEIGSTRQCEAEREVEQPLLNDAQVQQRKNLYAHFYDRLSWNRHSIQ